MCSLCENEKILARGLCSRCYHKQNRELGKVYKGKVDRNKYIIEQRKTGRTYKNIGEEFGLTRQRIEFICNNFNKQ